ncbi:MAG: CinA family nicotinamide mononucleotide deamidase-related protein [Deltaproteobacteria bacterium]|nr:CinA family nicotinamide mononucleotide deamidase-related protein [Deltaproteobacteria bacterium]MDL1960718.1 CinA family nicotinamide mononucleotide deamidase-related protein [Deltaproteobacteria bacterium]
MHGEIIAIGDELVSGKVLNTTASFAANKLFSAGCQVTRITSIGDDPDDIEECLLTAIKRSKYVIITGGLGPTTDDITNEVTAKALGRPLVLNEMILEKIRRAKRRFVNPVSLREKLAWLPEGAEILNPEGRAAGYLLVHQDIPLFFLPGVPGELEDHMVQRVIPRLNKFISKKLNIRQQTFKVFGLSETEINTLFENLESSRDGLSIGYYPNFPEVNVTATVKGLNPEKVAEIFQMACNTIKQLLDKHVVAVNEETLEAIVGRLLLKNRGVLALAESCTGGLLSQRVTSIPGSSGWFERGVITYSDKSKEDLLGVSHETLSLYGAVSSQTAVEMANGVKRSAGTGYSLAITGIAGPASGTSQKPVGTVYIALSTPERTVVEQFRFFGTRHMIQALAAETALDWLRRYLSYGTYFPGYRPAEQTA